MIDITEVFCKVDDFLKEFMPEYERTLLSSKNPRVNKSSMNLSEILTILTNFHVERYRDFKAYYTRLQCSPMGFP